ncbi:flagellar motor protein MotB [Neoroseomonas oryzicola]|uniref:OmpA family protein n=1 Tax=Neoroseomonas oryzicola TaxID=535904 RepID=A0A9X9WBT3_9PROT|nr:flagellar motor protein MotB [Neoroseomonas oryzicola]MBR0657793.1 OmpA family protein [Neoroseomonas oryzicola]NKE18639.1 OmpA family protein [Neoroseomonas oryzicola]
MAGKAKGDGRATIVIRREEGGEHGHHGGAWKVAYADFVTAMMAFFLLMWLLNATTEEQRRGLADYFAPTNLLARSVSGSGQPFGGQTPNDDGNQTSTTGAMTIQQGRLPIVMDIEEDESETPARPMPRREGPEGAEDAERPRTVTTSPPGAQDGTQPPRGGPAETSEAAPEALGEAELRRELARREREAFDRAAEQIRQAVAADPALADLARQLRVEQTPEGLRIQLLDAERQPMFALGGAAPNERARALLARVAQATARLPNQVDIAGHTDATPFRGGGDRSNWDLSAERANVTRRLLTEAGLPEARIRSVSGRADRDPLLPDQPNAAANRRVSITLLRQVPEALP